MITLIYGPKGSGKTKKQAEQMAAKQAICEIKKQYETL